MSTNDPAQAITRKAQQFINAHNTTGITITLNHSLDEYSIDVIEAIATHNGNTTVIDPHFRVFPHSDGCILADFDPEDAITHAEPHPTIDSTAAAIADEILYQTTEQTDL